jgi:hypothetical protein
MANEKYEFGKCPSCDGTDMSRDEADIDYNDENGYETWVCFNEECNQAFTIYFNIQFTHTVLDADNGC